MPSGQAVDLDHAAFDAFVQAPGLAFVDFGASWCPPCRRMDPLVDRLAAEPGLRVGKVDCDAHPELAARHGVQGLPTFLLFRDGRLAGRATGAMSAAALQDFVRG